MKKFTLSVGERMGIGNLLNSFQGGLQQVNMCFKVLDKVVVDEKERKIIEFKQEFSRGGLPQVKWNPRKEKSKEIEFSDDQAKLITEQIQLKSDKGEMSMSDIFLLELAKKFGMDVGDEEKKEEKDEKKKNGK